MSPEIAEDDSETGITPGSLLCAPVALCAIAREPLVTTLRAEDASLLARASSSCLLVSLASASNCLSDAESLSISSDFLLEALLFTDSATRFAPHLS